MDASLMTTWVLGSSAPHDIVFSGGVRGRPVSLMERSALAKTDAPEGRLRVIRGNCERLGNVCCPLCQQTFDLLRKCARN